MGMTSSIYGWAGVKLDERDLVTILRLHGYEVRKAGDPSYCLQRRKSFAVALDRIGRSVRGHLIEKPEARAAYEALCHRYWQPCDGFEEWWDCVTTGSKGFNPAGMEGL